MDTEPWYKQLRFLHTASNGSNKTITNIQTWTLPGLGFSHDSLVVVVPWCVDVESVCGPQVAERSSIGSLPIDALHQCLLVQTPSFSCDVLSVNWSRAIYRQDSQQQSRPGVSKLEARCCTASA